ncbi:MAG: hypothetical protein KAS32_19405 [Candidatus Peribacteraceae bacterium]|nr:hypothetical protein [Candidatus Peribacteraceae bacterium]
MMKWKRYLVQYSLVAVGGGLIGHIVGFDDPTKYILALTGIIILVIGSRIRT